MFLLNITSEGTILSTIYMYVYPTLIEPRHEKTCLRGLRPGKTQTGLRSQRS